MAEIASQEWLDEYADRITSSAAYRRAAAGWEGAVGLVFAPDPSVEPVEESRCALLELREGVCRSARQVARAQAEAAPFVIRAAYSRWKQVLRGEIDPIEAMMQGALQLTGDLPSVVRFVRAGRELLALAVGIPAEFPDEHGSPPVEPTA